MNFSIEKKAPTVIRLAIETELSGHGLAAENGVIFVLTRLRSVLMPWHFHYLKTRKQHLIGGPTTSLDVSLLYS